MDLVALANRQGPEAAAAAERWLQELHDGDDYARAARRHLDAEENLPLDPAGLEAVGRLVDQLPAAAGDALRWYRAQLMNEALRLTCQGLPADPAFPEALCRLCLAQDMADWLVQPDQAPVSDAGEDELLRWTERVCGLGPQKVLRGEAVVRGRLPLAFVAAQEDVMPFAAQGAIVRLRHFLGLADPRFPGEPHVLMEFRRADTGPAAVPTAFDAGDHLYFRPAPRGAGYGRTLDRGDPAEAGSRELVVHPFAARWVSRMVPLPGRGQP